MSFSFNKEQKLDKAGFDRVMRKPRKLRGKGFLLFTANSDEGFRKLGLIVPKKAVAKANERNTIKRIVREQFRLKQCSMPKVDIVFLAQREIQANDLKEELTKLWKRLSA